MLAVNASSLLNLLEERKVELVGDTLGNVRQNVGTTSKGCESASESHGSKGQTLSSVVGVGSKELEDVGTKRGKSDLRLAGSPSEVEWKSLLLEQLLHVIQACGVLRRAAHGLNVETSLSAAEDELQSTVGDLWVAVQAVLDTRVPSLRSSRGGSLGGSVEVGEELVEDGLVEVVVVTEEVVFPGQ